MNVHRKLEVRTVEVEGARPYTISIGANLLDDGALLSASLRGRHALIVSDTHVAELYAPHVEAALRAARPDLSLARFVMSAGEDHKTLASFGDALPLAPVLDAGPGQVRVELPRPAEGSVVFSW